VLKYVHLSLIHAYRVRQDAQAAILKAASFPEGQVDVAADDLFVVTSAAYGFLQKVLVVDGRAGGLCEVLDRGDAFGYEFHKFAKQVDLLPNAQFVPSPLDLAAGKTAAEVVRLQKPPETDCDHATLNCQQDSQMFCVKCLGSDHLEAEYWHMVDMMAATVMNALSDALDAKNSLQHASKKELTESCKAFFGARLAA